MSNAFDRAVHQIGAGQATATALAQSLYNQLTEKERLETLDGDLWFSQMLWLLRDGLPKTPWPAGAVPRLGIPGIQFSDGPRGCTMAKATCFPVTSARGATFNVELEERVVSVFSNINAGIDPNRMC